MFTKAHLNVSFQSVDLKTGSIYKSSSINPFHYAPQTNCVLVNRTSRKNIHRHYLDECAGGQDKTIEGKALEFADKYMIVE